MKEIFLSPYNPKETEGKIYELWEKSGFFNPDNIIEKGLIHKNAEPFTIIMPPPNANGDLHAGHALFITLEDIMTRFKRMRGFKALWVPGADHAGFETQVVYEKKLEKEGRSRFGMDPDALYKEILDFTLTNKKNMEAQVRSLGASCDWSREKFTLDPDVVKKTQDTFIKMFNEGIAYRGKRTINWCSKHQTSLSEVETDSVEEATPFYYFKYGPFEIGTVRPETKFGDKYVVMHPDDNRYKEYEHRQKLKVEWINGEIEATVIKDSSVDMEFGTGVMTITPWHSQVDYEIAKRHNLDMEQIIDWRGKLLPIAEEFQGMNIKDAREKIVEKLKSKGLVTRIDEKYKNVVKRCYKCNTIIEPQIKDQWFVKMEPLAKMALDSIDKGEIKFIPDNYEKIFRYWMNNTIDWNISRQIVWGIPIPAWFKTQVGTKMEAVYFSKNTLFGKLGITSDSEFNKFSYDFKLKNPEDSKKELVWQAPNAGDKIGLSIGYINFLIKGGYIDESWLEENRLNNSILESEIFVGQNPPDEIGWVKDPDTFDTWFSSGQWPLMTTGFPEKEDFGKYYPTDVMETGHDLIFKWVPRMVIFGLYLTNKAPFHTVYLHGLVNDAQGKKMSKSKGNVINPLTLTEKYGTDSLRMALIVGNTPGTDLALQEDKVKGYKNFANKLWNITRYVLNSTEGFDGKKPELLIEIDLSNISEIEELTKDITKDMDEYRYYMAAEKLYHYIWHSFADKIIEGSKEKLKSEDSNVVKSTQYTLLYLLKTSLKLLHPFMPFVTEEIWSHVKTDEENLLIVTKWPI